MSGSAWSNTLHPRQEFPGWTESRDTRPASPRHFTAPAPRRHRTIFISDIHIGTRGCKADLLLDFLKHNSCDTLYIVGDLIDGWRLKRRWFWTDAHTKLIRTILKLPGQGTKVIYIPGNHDEFLRPWCGHHIAGIEIENEVLFENARGQRFWVLHGDRFDRVVRCARWLAEIGDLAYALALAINDRLFTLREYLGLPYWSVSAFLKNKVKKAVEYVSRYECIVAEQAATLGVDGVICGHIHQAEIRHIGKIIYLNDGDWVESCTALVEDALGNMEILHWAPFDTASHLASAGTEPAQEAALIPV